MNQNIEDAWNEFYALQRTRGFTASWILSTKEAFIAGWEAAKFDTAKEEKSQHLN